MTSSMAAISTSVSSTQSDSYGLDSTLLRSPRVAFSSHSFSDDENEDGNRELDPQEDEDFFCWAKRVQVGSN